MIGLCLWNGGQSMGIGDGIWRRRQDTDMACNVTRACLPLQWIGGMYLDLSECKVDNSDRSLDMTTQLRQHM